MANVHRQSKILIVDDEWESPIVKAVRRRLEEEEWSTVAVEPETQWVSGDEFETATLYAIAEEHPDAVLLDVRLGEYDDDRFKGLGILRKIVEQHPSLPVLMFTQYVQVPSVKPQCGAPSSGMRQWTSSTSWPAPRRLY